MPHTGPPRYAAGSIGMFHVEHWRGCGDRASNSILRGFSILGRSIDD
jgi:hypothetical protein